MQRVGQPGWGYTANLFEEIVKEDSGSILLTTSSMCVEVKAISERLDLVKLQAITHIVYLTDTLSTLAKI